MSKQMVHIVTIMLSEVWNRYLLFVNSAYCSTNFSFHNLVQTLVFIISFVIELHGLVTADTVHSNGKAKTSVAKQKSV